MFPVKFIRQFVPFDSLIVYYVREAYMRTDVAGKLVKEGVELGTILEIEIVAEFQQKFVLVAISVSFELGAQILLTPARLVKDRIRSSIEVGIVELMSMHIRIDCESGSDL